jgi:dCTP deaminase
MILSDSDIKKYIKEGKIKISPFDMKEQLKSVGVDLRLSNIFREFKISHKSYVDLTKKQDENDTDLITVREGSTFMIHPGEFVLGMTVESVEIPVDLIGRLDGRSSLGRLGIIVHSTAGRIDPGWKGRLTLEVSNIGKLPVALIPGMRFCYLMFEQVSSTVEKPYQGKYSGLGDPAASRISEEMPKK